MSVYSHICIRTHNEALQTFLSKNFLCLQGQTNTTLYFRIKCSNNLWQPSGFVNILFFFVMYYPIAALKKRELSCYTAEMIRGNKGGGITKVFLRLFK